MSVKCQKQVSAESGDCRETWYIDRCMKVLNTYWCQPVAMFIMQEHIEALSL